MSSVKARHIIFETLEAARETLLIDPELTGVSAFNVFGFDLMVTWHTLFTSSAIYILHLQIDADMVVKLIEVNSSPAVAEELLEPLVKELVQLIAPSSDGTCEGWELVESTRV